MSRLPPFLQPLDDNVPSCNSYQNATFHHHGLATAHAFWWPAADGHSPETVLLFIPGNPGLLEFYTSFLSAIHEQAASGTLAIFAHSHIGHTPGIPSTRKHNVSLTVQVQCAIEAFDAVKSTFGGDTRVMLIGHSVGAWVALQIMKSRPQTAAGLFLLFPTISQIKSTPNGRTLSWIFRYPMPDIVSAVSHITKLLPMTLLAFLFRSWPLPQLLVLRKLLHSPSAIFACLTMAHDEMLTIRDLDITLLNEHHDRIWMYFAEKDDWIGTQKSYILSHFQADTGTVRVVHGHQDIPHAFCINHGEPLALQCSSWLSSAGFL